MDGRDGGLHCTGLIINNWTLQLFNNSNSESKYTPWLSKELRTRLGDEFEKNLVGITPAITGRKYQRFKPITADTYK